MESVFYKLQQKVIGIKISMLSTRVHWAQQMLHQMFPRVIGNERLTTNFQNEQKVPHVNGQRTKITIQMLKRKFIAFFLIS